MRILVIGGTGFVGRRVVRRLARRGHAVTVVHRGRTRAELPLGVEAWHADRRRIGDLSDRIAGLAPDVVLDAVAMTADDAEGAIAVARGTGARIVAISSGDVYRAYGALVGLEEVEPSAGPLAEDAPLRTSLYPYRDRAEGLDDPRYRYDKILVERAYRAADPRATVLRLPAVYGPGDPRRRFGPWVRRMLDERPAILLEEGRETWRWSRGYVDDVARAVAIACVDERAAGRTFNVGEAEAPTEVEWIELLAGATGWDGRAVAVPDDLHPDPLDHVWRHDLVLDTTAIRDALEWSEATTREEAVERTVAWERETGNGSPLRAYAAETRALERFVERIRSRRRESDRP